MFSKFKNIVLQIDYTYGVEVSLLPGGDMIINAVALRLKKNKIIKEKAVHFLHSLEELVEKFPPGPPVALTVNGKGILNKRIPLQTVPENIFDAILPNSNPNEFYLDVTAYVEFNSASIIRKETLDKLIQMFIEHRYKVLSVSIGTTGIQYLLPFLHVEDQPVIKSNHYSFIFNNKKELAEIRSLPFEKDGDHDKTEYSIGDQYILSPSLLSFGAATGLLAGSSDINQGINNVIIQSQREDYRYFRYYRSALWALLAGIFAILFVNFLLYNYYFTRNMERQSTRILNQGAEIKTEKLKAEIDAKETFIRQYGWDQPSRLSFFADRIAGLVPENTTLTDMKIFPVNTGFFGDNTPMSFKKDTIQIIGICEDPTELNRFTNNLKNIREFREVNIKNYTYKVENQTGIFLMQIITF